MRFGRLSLPHEGVLGIGPLVVTRFADVELFAKSASYAVDDIGLGTGKMISNLNRSLRSRYFINVANESTCFASCASSLKFPG